jgi:hypothetical protein
LGQEGNIPFFIGANTPFQKEKPCTRFLWCKVYMHIFLAAARYKGLPFAAGRKNS